MGRRMMGLVAAAATGLTAPVAWGQPEYLRLDPGGNINAAPWIDIDGDVLAWSETPGPPHTGMTTHIWRRTAAGWRQEAEIYTPSRYDAYGALTAVDGYRVAMRAFNTGLHVWRREGNRWVEEPVAGNEFYQPGEQVALSGEWLVIPVRDWGQWEEPLALVLRFDGKGWRIHSRLEAPTGPDHLPIWIAIEGDLLAISGQQGSSGLDPAPVIIFRLEDGQWRHEATLPLDTRWVAINEGRVATVGAGGLLIYSEVAPGEWAIESVAPGIRGHFVLDGDTAVAMEQVVPAEWMFTGRAIVFSKAGSDWVRTRALYPSNTFTLEHGSPGYLPYALFQYGPIAHAGGEVFAVTVETDPHTSARPWRLVVFPACRADFNGDGVADFADLVAFLEGRAAGMMSADYDMDVTIGWARYWDEEDFLEFMRALEEGC